MTKNNLTKQKFNIRCKSGGKLYDFNRFLIWTEQYKLTDKVTLLFTENNFNVNYGKIERFKNKSMYILINNIAIFVGLIQYEGMKKKVIEKLKKDPSTLQDYIKNYYLSDKPFKSCNFIEPIKKPKEVLYKIRYAAHKENRRDIKRTFTIIETFTAQGFECVATKERYTFKKTYEPAIYLKQGDCYVFLTSYSIHAKEKVKESLKSIIEDFIKKYGLDTESFGTYK